MAVGTVSGVNQTDNWQLISSVTASSTAVTFNSISGYSRLMVVYKAMTTSASVWIYLRVNNDSTGGNYASCSTYTSADQLQSDNYIVLTGTPRTTHSGSIVIENTDKSIPHQISEITNAFLSSYTASIALASPITRVDILGGTFTGGTVELWGVAS
jgi:hypothetical protein